MVNGRFVTVAAFREEFNRLEKRIDNIDNRVGSNAIIIAKMETKLEDLKGHFNDTLGATVEATMESQRESFQKKMQDSNNNFSLKKDAIIIIITGVVSAAVAYVTAQFV